MGLLGIVSEICSLEDDNGNCLVSKNNKGRACGSEKYKTCANYLVYMKKSSKEYQEFSESK